MKMLIDIDRELAEGNMTAADHARLKSLGRRQMSDLALNILIGFGVMAFTVGFATMSESVVGLIVEGAVITAAALPVVLRSNPRWRFVGQLLLVIGLILVGGGSVAYDAFSARSVFAAAALLFAAAMFIGSGLLASLAVLALSGALGAGTAYAHAEYTLIIDRPAEAIGVFTLLAVVCVAASAGPLRGYERVLIIAARTSALLVNFAFLVGSLSGDRIGAWQLSPVWFTVGWAVVLLLAAVWSWSANRRWPLVAATVFAAIHFYTQLFERLGANPGSILIAGLATLATGLILKVVLGRSESPPQGAGLTPQS